MWEKIVAFFSGLSYVDIVSPRRALLSYIKAIMVSDVDGNGELNTRELIKLTKTNFKNLVFADDMTDEEIHQAVDKILNEKV